jgi:phospho-N-acetylmuramoyl-pentapeptide-transferase
MGGLLIYFSVTVSLLLWARPNVYVLTCLLVYTGLTVIGFLDDFLKVSRRNSRGLSSRYKLAGQAMLTLGALALLWQGGGAQVLEQVREFWVPFFKAPVIASMPVWFLVLFFFLVMAGSSNAINLTDGIDGLAIGCTVSVALVYGVMAYASGHAIIAEYLLISFVPEAAELTIICGAMVGAGLAFLWFNCHPATVFMGDTGSLALGGLIGTIAFLVHQPLTLILVGGIFVMEAVSVMLQVFSFKTRGRRVFRMAPIHHHFELGGWAESKVVIRFWILSLIFAIAGLSTLKLR